MYLEDFKHIFRHKSLVDKIDLLIEQMELVGANRSYAVQADMRHNRDDYEYFTSEKHHMEDRAAWLRDEILREIKNDKRMIANYRKAR